MDKQEKIRGDLEKTIQEGIMQNLPVEVIANAILHGFHSQGAVLRVEGELDELGDIGIYPKVVIGGKNPYKKRSPYQNGWNDGVMEVTKKLAGYARIESLIKEE